MDGRDELPGMFAPQGRLAVQLSTQANGYVESFNGKLRDECLNVNWFENLWDVRRKIAAWQKEYNEERPHSALGYQTPAAFAQQRSLASSGSALRATPDEVLLQVANII